MFNDKPSAEPCQLAGLRLSYGWETALMTFPWLLEEFLH